MSITRHEMRETAFILTFERIFCTGDSTQSLEQTIEIAKENDQLRVNETVVELFLGVQQNITQIDECIKEFLQDWSILRIAKVSLAVLRVAVYEILFCDNIPNAVAIDEAVEITKKYSTKAESQFVNGVLGKLAKKLETV